MIKKVFGMILFIILVTTLTACNQQKSDYISQKDLTDREESILTILTEEAEIFEFKQSTYKEAKLFVEKYEFGKLVDDSLGSISTDIDENGYIIFARAKSASNMQNFHIGIEDDNGSGSSVFIDELVKTDDYSGVMFGRMPDEKAIAEEMVLAALLYSDADSGEGVSSLTTTFFENPDEYMNELNDFAVTYLVKVSFSK